MADSNKLVSLNSILGYIREHLMEWGNDATSGKIYSNSTGYLWGVIAKTASQDYYLRINSNYFTFSNKIAESSTIDDTWKINANNIVTSATAPLSIATTTSSGVVTGAKISISAATASAAGSMSSADKTKLDKISVGTDSATLGDSVTTALAIWGNSTNKVAISATNSSSGDGHRYAIRAQVDGIQLYDYSSGTSGSAVYKIYPTSGTSPISVSNGVVSIQAASDSQNGYLSSTLYTKLNSKVATLGNIAASGNIYSNATSTDGSTGNVAGLSLTDTNGNTYLLAATASLLHLRTKVSSASSYTTTWAFPAKNIGENFGTYITAGSGNVPVANSTTASTSNFTTKLCEVTLTPGRWIINLACPFAANSTGVRMICLSSTANTGSQIGNNFLDVRPSVGSSTYTTCAFTTIITINNTTTYYANACQNSGGELNAYPRLRALCISAVT